jgi:predicted RNA-binding protein with PUA-like domain
MTQCWLFKTEPDTFSVIGMFFNILERQIKM